MLVAICLPLVIPLLAAVAARSLVDRLPPAAATWLLAASAFALALASSAVLGVLAVSALIRLPVIETIGHLSRSTVAHSDAVSVPVAIAAGALFAAAAAAAAKAAWRRAAAIARAHRHASRLPGAGAIVVTEDAAADAYTVPGWPCRIVITEGMLRALSAGERDVLLAHERTHARNSHYLFTSAARLAAAANPLLRPVAAEVGYAIERWADERAAAETGDRALAARAIAHAALATSAAPPDRDAAITALGLITQEGKDSPEGKHRKNAARRAGPVPRRVAALLAPPLRLSPLLIAAVVVLVAVSGASALAAAINLHQLIEIAQGQLG
jgi:beta-lactamase regulating signal transducer with metallopeptidase domain